MKRYGDNLPVSNISEDEVSGQHGRHVAVMYGGCGVSFGSFPKPIEYPKKRKSFHLFSLLGFRRNKDKNENK